jgi:hypothetical protein
MANTNSTVKRKDLSYDSIFFLFTKINENQTKSLKKAKTNKQERQLISEMF